MLDWSEVDRAYDSVEEGGDAQCRVVEVFLNFEGRALNVRDARGARQTVNISSFCHRYGLHRNTFRNWMRKHAPETQMETA